MSWLSLIKRAVNHTQSGTGFDFGFLWDIALAINSSNATSDSLFHPGDNRTRICLTYDACVANVGPNSVRYSQRDVYDRVILWRVPLIALVATTTLPALGLHTQFFTILHLIASPIDALWSLFYKLDLARRHTDWAADNNANSLFTFKPESAKTLPTSQAHDEAELEHPFLANRKKVLTGLTSNEAQQNKELSLRQDGSPIIKRYDLDVMALIVNAYQEWHFGEQAKNTIINGFRSDLSVNDREAFRNCCGSAAASIAADRVSRILPSFVATLVFFTQLFAAFWKTLDTLKEDVRCSDPSRFSINRTPHNIAFGSLYFWLPFAVLSTAFIGGAQTENSVPRILNRLRNDTRIIFPSSSTTNHRIEQQDIDFPELDFSMSKRRIAGGLPTWQPDKFQDWNNTHIKFFLTTFVLSTLIVAIPAVAAIWLSWRTPTEGFGCRTLTQVCFFASWLISSGIDWTLTLVFQEPKKEGSVRSQWFYWITFIKDLSLTTGAITMLTYTAIGIFNSCNCWTKWLPYHSGRQRYISFPEEALVYDTIRHRLKFEFAVVTTVTLGIELVVFLIVWFFFRRGHQVLKQRDLEMVLSKGRWWTGLWIYNKKPFRQLQINNQENDSNTKSEDVPFETRPFMSPVIGPSRHDTSSLESQSPRL